MIDTKALRSKVLDLAIQGKLTQQLASDGTAEELFALIQEEKQKLIKEGKIKKEKALPPISDDEIPFEIPSNWKWVKVKDLTLLYNGKAFKPSDWSESGLPIVRIQNLNNPNAPFNYYDGIIDDSFLLFGSELLFAWSGTPGTSFGAHIWRKQKAVLNQHIFRLDYNKDVIDQEYFKHVLNQRVMLLITQTHGSSGLQHVTKGVFENTLIPLPPLSEQKRIVEKVESIFRLLDIIDEAQKKYSADAEILKSKLISMGIQGKLTQQLDSDGSAQELFEQIQQEKQKLIKEGKIKKEKPLPPVSEAEIPFEIPENWMWVRWGNLSESIQYGYNAPAKDTGRIKMVRITDIQNNRVCWDNVPYCEIEEDAIDTYKLSNDDILFARTGGTVGKSFIVTNINEDAVFAGYLIRTRYSSNLSGRYLKYFMESELYWKQLRFGTTSTAQPNCNATTLSRMCIPLPPLAEQKRIAQVLDEVLNVISR